MLYALHQSQLWPHSHMQLAQHHPSLETRCTDRLDLALAERWCAGAAEHASLGAVRNVLRAFRAACHHGDAPTSGNVDHDEDGGGAVASKRMRIASDAAFHKILVFTLTEADTFFRRLLGVQGKARLADADFTGAKCALDCSSNWESCRQFVARQSCSLAARKVAMPCPLCGIELAVCIVLCICLLAHPSQCRNACTMQAQVDK